MNRNKPFTFILRSLLVCIPMFFLAFTTGDNRSQYNVPLAAYSVTAGDIDMDGDNDIIVGHNYSSQTQWSGVSFLLNDEDGNFSLNDSIFLYSWQTHIYAVNTDNDSFPEIIARHYENEIQYMAVLNFEQGDYVTNLYDMSYGISGNNIGDINGDYFTDIVIYSNDNQFWGIMYNDGNGNFSEPEYHYVSGYFPAAIACGDLNSDNRDDIVVCGQSTEVYFSYPDGFQSLLLETNNFKEGVSIVDFDFDGDNDILTFVGIPIIGVTSLIMYENQGNNILDTLPEFYFQPMSSRFLVTDFNNDSLQDILFQLSDKSGYLIYYNQGDFQLADSQFVALSPSNPQEGWRNCYCADMDGNGYTDIITVKTLYTYLPDNLEILFNDGNGNFEENPITGIQPSTIELQPSNLSCYPNPFTTETTISITIELSGFTQLHVFDLNGKLVSTLINKELQTGNYKFIWDGTDMYDRHANSGIYMICLEHKGNNINQVKLIKN